MADGLPYKVLALEDLERVPLDHGVWRPVRRALGVTAFGVNAYTADHAGDTLIEPHDEISPGSGGHEELYLTATGRASFTVANQKVDAPAGTMLLVEPGTRRHAVAAEDSTTVLVIGGRPGAAMPPSPFEYWYSAIPASSAGDFERAYAVVGEGLEHWPRHGASTTRWGVTRRAWGATRRRLSTCASHSRRILERASGRPRTPTSTRFATTRVSRSGQERDLPRRPLTHLH